MAENTKVNPAQAAALLEQLRDGYLAALPGTIDSLEASLLSLPQAADASEVLSELYRQFHSLKGSAGSYGLDLVTRICHEAEEQLTRAVNGTVAIDEAFVDRCLGYLDLVRDVVDGAREHDDSVLQHVVHALDQVRSEVLDNRIAGLVIEQSALNVELYKAVLADLNVHLVHSNSSHEALQRILTEPFDVLITAQEMPVLCGSALIAAIKCSQPPQPLCVLITSNESLDIAAPVAPDRTIVRGAGMKSALHDVVASLLTTRG